MTITEGKYADELTTCNIVFNIESDNSAIPIQTFYETEYEIPDEEVIQDLNKVLLSLK